MNPLRNFFGVMAIVALLLFACGEQVTNRPDIQTPPIDCSSAQASWTDLTGEERVVTTFRGWQEAKSGESVIWTYLGDESIEDWIDRHAQELEKERKEHPVLVK